MGVVAMLIVRPTCAEQTFVAPAHEGSIWNLALISQVVSEEKMFEKCGRRTDGEACLYYKLTYEPRGSGELKMNMSSFEIPIILVMFNVYAALGK